MARSGLLFLDSDLFVLLSGAGLLPIFIETAGFAESRTRRLEPLPFMLKRGRLARRYPEELRSKAAAWCSKIAPVEAAPPPEFFDRLIQIDDIDEGEALLLAFVAQDEHSVLATGDLRACRRLNTAGLAGLQGALEGKIICLERALEMLLGDLGYARLRETLIPVRAFNTTLRILLSQGELTSESGFREGLDSYLGRVMAEVGRLLHR